MKELKEADLVISHRYTHRLSPVHLRACARPPINCHAGVLPHVRGVHPVFASIITGKSIGWTIHEMDTHLDTGPIIRKGLVPCYYPHQTFRYVHQRVEADMVAGLYAIWNKIQDRTYDLEYNDKDKGRYYSMAWFKRWEHLLVNGWDTLCSKARLGFEMETSIATLGSFE